MRRELACLMVAATVVLAGCGDDDDSRDQVASTPSTASTTGDLERYCALVAELDGAGSEAFAHLEQDESATDADYARAERKFLKDHAAEFAELGTVAPVEIRADVAVLVAAAEARAAGGEQEETDPATAAAEKRVQRYEKQNC